MVSLYIPLIVTVAEDDKSVLVLIIPTPLTSYWSTEQHTALSLAEA